MGPGFLGRTREGMRYQRSAHLCPAGQGPPIAAQGFSLASSIVGAEYFSLAELILAFRARALS